MKERDRVERKMNESKETEEIKTPPPLPLPDARIAGLAQLFFFVVVFFFEFYGPSKNISLISSRSFIKGGRKPENPGKKPPDHL